MTKLSVIIPNYNKEKYIGECLDSIMNQDYKDFEVIVIDDNSSDLSVNIISNYNVKLIKHNYNMGAPACRNEGIMNSCGDYILFFDSDDIMEKNILKKCMKKIISSGCDLLVGNYNNLYGNNIEINKKNCFKDDILDKYDIFNYLTDISPVPCNKFFKRSIILDNNIFWSNVSYYQDFNFYYKYILFCNMACTINDVIYSHRWVNNSIYNSLNFNLFDSAKVIDDIRNFYNKKGYLDLYNNYLVVIMFRNCSINLDKSRFYNSYKERLAIVNFFSIVEKRLDYSKSLNYDKYKYRIFKFHLKVIFKYIFCSRLFIFFSNKKGNVKNYYKES